MLYMHQLNYMNHDNIQQLDTAFSDTFSERLRGGARNYWEARLIWKGALSREGRVEDLQNLCRTLTYATDVD